MGSKKPPKPSAAETALLQQQQALLAQVMAQLNRPKSEAELRAEAIQKAYDERLQRALAGDIPLDPNLERDIAEQRASTEAYLTRALGPNFAASTPGQMGLGRLNEDIAGRRFRAREAFIAGTESPSSSRFALGQGLEQQRVTNPLMVSGSINPFLSYYQGERYTPYNIEQQRMAGILRGLGGLAGAGTSFYTQGFAMPRAIRSLGQGYGQGIPYSGNPPYTGNIG